LIVKLSPILILVLLYPIETDAQVKAVAATDKIAALSPRTANSSPVPATSKTDSAEQLLTVEGQAGIWFPMGKARAMLKDLETAAGLRTERDLLDRRLSVEKERVVLLGQSLKSTEQIVTLWKEAAESQSKLLVDKQPWWRSPVLWTAVGFVVGAGATIGIALAVKNSGVTN
jgi:hypothetical protein